MRNWPIILAFGLLACGEGTLESTAAPDEVEADGWTADGDGGVDDDDAHDARVAIPRPDGAVAPPGDGGEPPEPPVFEPLPPTLFRLTRAQYRNSVRDLLGDVTLPDDLEADTPLHGFASVGASEITISPLAAEQYEAAAGMLMAQVFDPARRVGFVGCDDPTPDCVRAFFARFGRRAWRRPLSEAEIELFAGLVEQLADELQDRWQGLEYAATGLLQSPDFLFRVEVGEDAGDGRRYTGYEMASRLAFLFWNSTPDDALLDAAERGELVTDVGLRAQAVRLLADPRARETMRAYFGEYFNLGRLDALEKSREIFPQMSPTLGASMRTEIESVIDHLVFEADADLRDLLTTRQTFVNAELAALYNLPAVDGAGFVPAELPADGPRGGLMSMAGILALNAHNTVTSPTHRGKFIQNNLLCVDIPPPPPGVVTSLEEIPDDVPITTRQKLARHAEDPVCNSCHQFMDPMGLALENFDAIGAWRTTENGLPIDASANIAGERFVGARELGDLLRDQDRVSECIARRLYRHATGQLEGPRQAPAVAELTAAFEAGGHRFQRLLVELVVSDGFRRTGAIE